MQTTRRQQFGITMVETCCTLAVMAILASTGLPSFKGTIDRQALRGQASELSTDLQFLRTEVVSRNQVLRMAFGSDAGGSCYMIHSGPTASCRCDSTGSAQCEAGSEAIKTVGLPASRGVRLQSNVAAMQFDPLHGTVTPAGTLRLIDRENRAVNQIVNMLGRTRACSPGGAVSGYKTC